MKDFIDKHVTVFKNDIRIHYLLLPFVLFISSIFVDNKINSFLLIIIFILAFTKVKKFNFQKELSLFFLFFILSVASLLWTVDKYRTMQAIIRILPFIIIPLLFMTIEPFQKRHIKIILKYYSFLSVIFTIFCSIRAVIRYFNSQNTAVFFNHELVSKEVNAVHASVFVAIAFFYFFTIKNKSIWDKLYCFFLFGFIVLLNSYTILITIVLLITINYFYFSKEGSKMRLRNLIVLGLGTLSLLFAGKIEKIIEKEMETKTEKTLSHTVIEKQIVGNSVISVEEAWTKASFTPNDFFPGTAFRVFQFRIFIEMMQKDSAWLTGFGLNASYIKIEEMAKKYNLFLGNDLQEGYQKKNFHNQYIQTFADLGFLGFLLLIVILIINLKNAIRNKDFIHFAFAILMISLFLTESFLLRQRGIVFFAMMYCLFNSQNSPLSGIPKSEEIK